MLTSEEIHLSDAQEACERAADRLIEAASSALANPSAAAGQFLEARKGQFLQRCERLCFLLLKSTVDLEKYRSLLPQLEEIPIRWARNFSDPRLYPSIREVVRRWGAKISHNTNEPKDGRESGNYLVRILHVSDLHERETPIGLPEGIRIKREAVIRKDRTRRPDVLGGREWALNLDWIRERQPYHLVVFTGDIADWGLPEEYVRANRLIEELLDATGLDRSRLFCVPGNHDIDRRVNKEEWELIRGRGGVIGPWLASEEGAPRGIDDDALDKVLQREAAFWDWFTRPVSKQGLGRSDLHPSKHAHKRLGYRQALRDPSLPFPIQVLGFDTAWLAGDENDAGKLRLTEEQVRHLSMEDEKLLPGFRIALGHHPLGELAAQDRARCSRLLADRVDIYLHGHQHEAAALTLSDPDRIHRTLAAGCLFEGSAMDGHANGFHVLEANVSEDGELTSYAVYFRAWAERGHWHNASNLYRNAVNGVWICDLTSGAGDRGGDRRRMDVREIGGESRVEQLIADYIRELRRATEAPAKRLVSRLAYAGERPIEIPSSPSPSGSADIISICNNGRTYVYGPSGRGKSSVCTLFARLVLDSSPQKIPVFLDVADDSRNVHAGIVASFRKIAPDVSADEEVQLIQRLTTQGIVLIVDDWQRVSHSLRASLVSASDEGISWFIAGTEIAPPPIRDVQHLELRPYADREMNGVLERSEGGAHLTKVVAKFEPGIRTLMREPVFLECMLKLGSVLPFRFGRLPRSVPEIMYLLFSELVQRHQSAQEVTLAELMYLCRRAAGSAELFDPLKLYSDTEGRVHERAGHVTTTMIGIGIWKAHQSGLVAFAHEVWRTYFRASGLSEYQGAWSSHDGITRWVRETDASHVRQMLPFVCGMVSDIELQDTLFDSLLRRDLDLYLSALGVRCEAKQPHNEIEWQRLCLEQLHRGYFDLLESMVSPLVMRTMDPWKFIPDTPDAPVKPVTVGEVLGNRLIYYFGNADPKAPDVLQERMQDRREHGFLAEDGGVVHDLYLSCSADSGRLISSRRVFSQLKEMLETKQLPTVGWMKRERVQFLVQQLSNWGHLTRVQIRTVRSIVKWARAQRQSGVRRMGRFVDDGLNAPASAVDIQELADLAEQLVEEGLGSKRIVELGILGRASGCDVDVEDAESVAVVEGCAQTLYAEIARTYRLVCVEHFPCADEAFFYAQFPCLPRVNLYVVEGKVAKHEEAWIVVKSWELDAVVQLNPSEGLDGEGLASANRYHCALWGRKYMGTAVVHGRARFLRPGAVAPVTEAVYSLLQQDLARLQKNLPLI